MEKELLEKQYHTLIDVLIKEQNSKGFWTGKLASSALATAVAIVALKIYGFSEFKDNINKGLHWLLDNVNNDGGYGDTPGSKSNVSTSLLCYAAISYCQSDKILRQKLLTGIEQCLKTQNINLNSGDITSSILKFYGKDYSFSVPILSMLIICKVLEDRASKHIPQLPFELTLLPASWYRFFSLQVVSYAIPALIAVGIFVSKKRKQVNPLTRLIRNKSITPALKKLSDIMPASGGFLEAIPLTGFVCICLVKSGIEKNVVIDKGIKFLEKQQRSDGSWPIDTDLSTWVTTLSIKALGSNLHHSLSVEAIEKLKIHLLNSQYKEKHPFNGALPGGWGWTDFSGSVPDADDTPGAILALLEMYEGSEDETNAIITGCKWLVKLQNSDGGLPTFCKGWARLPFDSSCADLTGHALAALTHTLEKLGDKIHGDLRKSFYQSVVKAARFLQKTQHSDGYWLPLWFGNQLTNDKKNPVYGTAKVSIYVGDSLECGCIDSNLKACLERMTADAQNYLLMQQNSDGSWGGKNRIKGTIEETALAISALAKTKKNACLKGFYWLEKEYRDHGLNSNPIGLYFAALWYDEKLYPLIYYIEAVRRFLQ